MIRHFDLSDVVPNGVEFNFLELPCSYVSRKRRTYRHSVLPQLAKLSAVFMV